MRRAAAAALLALVVPAPRVAAEPPSRAPGRASPPACRGDGPAPRPGSLDPFRSPAPEAAALNAAGKIPYRQGKWEEARAKYRAAEAADPEFLAPRLNVACSFVREERFAEATAEVISLLERAYVPWAREIREAADLGALKTRPESKQIEHAMAVAAARWSEGLDGAAVFVARQRPPLRVPDGPGVFILNPHQEVWAFSPKTQRYRQITAEDGHVVALAAAADGRIAYVTATKLVRGARFGDLALRGVTLHELDLTTMQPGGAATIDGDVRRIDIGETANGVGPTASKHAFAYDVDTDDAAVKGPRSITSACGTSAGGLASAQGRMEAHLVTLTATGVSAAPISGRGARAAFGCSARLLEQGGQTGPAGQGGLPVLMFERDEGPPLTLKPPFGAGTAGLPIP